MIKKAGTFLCPCGAWEEKIEKNRQKYKKSFSLFLSVFLYFSF
jgi:hypothetical protein